MRKNWKKIFPKKSSNLWYAEENTVGITDYEASYPIAG